MSAGLVAHPDSRFSVRAYLLGTASNAQARAVDDTAADRHARGACQVAGEGDLAMEVVRAWEGEAPEDRVGARRDKRSALRGETKAEVSLASLLSSIRGACWTHRAVEEGDLLGVLLEHARLGLGALSRLEDADERVGSTGKDESEVTRQVSGQTQAAANRRGELGAAATDCPSGEKASRVRPGVCTGSASTDDGAG